MLCGACCDFRGSHHNTHALKHVHTPQGALALNGIRVTSAVLDLVPRKDHFAIVLRAVKHWAYMRGVYRCGRRFPHVVLRPCVYV